MNGNSELGDMISRLTENPEMMKKLTELAGSLDLGGTRTAEEKPTDAEFRELPEKPKENRAGHPKRKNETENLIRLLIALKPYVNGERCSKIDNAVKLLKLLQLGEGAGLLKEFL